MDEQLGALFDLKGAVAVITGGAGALGLQHAETIARANGVPVLVDISPVTEERAAALAERLHTRVIGLCADITQQADVQRVLTQTLGALGRVDILINNAANNPQVKADGAGNWSRLENFSLETWTQDIAVGLTGAFLCSQVIGSELARQGHGVILNIASDLAVIAPDQRIYRQPGLMEEQQPVKPVTYSVVKTGLVGLTRYLATYWADRGVRVNSLSPGGVYAGQPDEFVQRLTNLIPLGRMAQLNEYQGAVLFLVSDASAYMTGANVVMDGGRTVW